MKIDILIGDNKYGTVIHFSKALAAAFERLGVETRLFWVGDGHFFHAFYEIMNDPPDLTCSFSAISLENQPLGSLWQIPHLFLMLDPPIYFLPQLTAKKGWFSCVDQKDCEFVSSLGFSNVNFIPHGVDSALKTSVGQDREFESVFFGSCIDYEAVAEGWAKKEKELLFRASEKVLAKEGLSISESLSQLDVTAADFFRLHNELDRYIRGKDRIELIRSMEGLPVHIWGDGPWEKYVPNQIIHPPIGFEETIQVMQKSKLVLNSSPRFQAGAHERIFYALMCGANVCTGANAYINSILPEIFTYTYGEWERPTFKEWALRAESAQKRVLESHTWDVRAEKLLSFLR